jgi:SAM domain (Sterile alpha motif)
VPEFSKHEKLRMWLEVHELASLNTLLTANDVDLEVLSELTDADLKELGFSFGQRRRLMKAAGDLQCLSVLWHVHIALNQDAKCRNSQKTRSYGCGLRCTSLPR